jgi:IclR family pca regulon transcriptional regulator
MTTKPNGVFSADEIAGWPSGSDEFVEAFAKGLAVIGAFGKGTGSLTITEIAERTGLPRAGVRRLLLTLVQVGLAEQTAPRFRLTAKAMRLGFAYLSSLGLPEIAQPLIERLAKEVNELVAMSVLDGPDIAYVARAEVRPTLDRSLSIGARLPAFATSMGRVLLAELDEKSLARSLGTDRLQRFTNRTVASKAALAALLGEVRRKGYALASEQIELGVCGLAVPIRGDSGRVIAALNISANLARHPERAFTSVFLPKLLSLREAIEGALPPGNI